MTTPELSTEDRSILVLLASGEKQVQIVRRLGLSPRGVHRRLASIRSHFGVETNIEAVVAAVKDEII